MSKTRILVVDDSPEIQILIGRVLKGLDLEVVAATTAAEGRARLAEGVYALVVLDVSLPDQDGFQLFGEFHVQERHRRTPVIFLTGHDDVAKKVAAFSMGAEDYVVKPFVPLEFKARVEAKLRRCAESEDSARAIRRGALRLDAGALRLYVEADGRESVVHLTPKEFKLLFQLASNEERVWSRAQLLDAVWGNEAEVFDRTVDANISSIRKKLGPCAHYIESVPGEGYRFSTAGAHKSQKPQASQKPAA